MRDYDKNFQEYLNEADRIIRKLTEMAPGLAGMQISRDYMALRPSMRRQQDPAIEDVIDVEWVDLSDTWDSPDAAEDEGKGFWDLSDYELNRLFAYFFPIPGVKEEIMAALEEVALNRDAGATSFCGNLIIQGERGNGRTALAFSMCRAVQGAIGGGAPVIGRISAQSLNKRDFLSLAPYISGGYLIITEAGFLDQYTASRISQVLGQHACGVTVILEDDSAGIRKALALDPDFAAKFTARIKIPVFTIDELVDFGKMYARENGYAMDESGVRGLVGCVRGMRRGDTPVTPAEIKRAVDSAMKRAEHEAEMPRYTVAGYSVLHRRNKDLVLSGTHFPHPNRKEAGDRRAMLPIALRNGVI